MLEQDLRLQSLIELTKGEKKLYIHVNGVNGIKESVYFAKKHNINDIVLVGASESWRITDFILEHNIPIILGRIHSLPNFRDDIDQPFKTPRFWQMQAYFALTTQELLICQEWVHEIYHF